MAGDKLGFGEQFGASVTKGGAPVKPEPKTRHYVMGWALILSLFAAIGYFGWGKLLMDKPKGMNAVQESPAFSESFQSVKPSNGYQGGIHLHGEMLYRVIKSAINIDPVVGNILKMFSMPEMLEGGYVGPFPNLIVDEGETALRDCFNNNTGAACTASVDNFNFHGIGTSATAVGETDGGCLTELTTQYNPDNTRATGTQSAPAANQYRTVGTNTVDASATIEEFCLMDVNTGAGLMWTRILTGTVSLSASDSLETTYTLTID